VELAKSSKPLEQSPIPAPKRDIDDLSNAINLPNRNRDGRDENGSRGDARDFPGGDHRWDGRVRQWGRDWVEYDEYYRPIICNPYRDPVRIIYIYQYAPRIVVIPPLARIVLEVAEFAAYSFTAVVVNAVDLAADVAVGTFFGGGYFPGVGLPLPVPPPPLWRYDNVPVQVRYSRAAYEPFRVRRIIDLGDDARYGERKVLLDGATPAWGEWTQTPSGERQFEVHKTQQFPGLDNPQEGPLPGDYQLRLASDTSSGQHRRDIYLMVAAGVIGALGLGALVFSLVLGGSSEVAGHRNEHSRQHRASAGLDQCRGPDHRAILTDAVRFVRRAHHVQLAGRIAVRIGQLPTRPPRRHCPKRSCTVFL
jgi:hypothetical protein